jgi:hypothetical protein
MAYVTVKRLNRHCTCASASTTAEIATMAQMNQRNERSLEIRLVESFCVTPVPPQRTRAIAEKTSQAGIRLSYMLNR